MKEQQSSYRQIIKATSIFGGVQIFNIIIAIIRSKIIAVLLGPTGMGIASLLTSTTGLISEFTNFGLETSAVRDIVSANETGNQNRINTVVSVFRRLVWVTGFSGAIVTLILSSWLSQLTFGNKEYTLAFVWLSMTLVFRQLTSGQNVVLQGMRKLKFLAKANMAGSMAGLFVSAPLYYFWGIDGIVPAIIITSLLSLSIALYFSLKVKLGQVKVNQKEIIKESKGMLKMGFMLSLSGLIATGTSYLVRIFISNIGGIDDVGLFNAGIAIISTYVGLVFVAMTTDYYPRLSAVANDNNKTTLLINQQAEIAILILAPILTIFIIFIYWIVVILYSIEFIPVNGMIQWAALGIYFKATSWSIGFILLAKGASKVFFWSELISNSYLLILNILGYKFLGLEGLGVSFLVSYCLLLMQVYYIAHYFYKFSFNTAFYKIFILQFILGLICFLVIRYIPTPLSYFIGLPFTIYSIWFSFKELDKRLDIKTMFESIKSKF